MQEHKALKSVLKYFKVSDGRMLIGGKTAEDIASEVGTPFYAYDLGIAKAKYDRLRTAMPARIEIHYAIKANSNPRIVGFFNRLGAGMDVASAGELDIARSAGVDPFRIGFAGPAKRMSEIELACDLGIGSLNVESEAELEAANGIAGRKQKKLAVSLRVNPLFELVGSGMKMGGGPKQFGIDQEEIPGVLQRFFKWPNLNFTGFHFFSGAQNLSAESISSSFERVVDAVIYLLPHCPNRPARINLGGGFGIPYYQSEEELDIEAVGRSVQKTIETRKELDGIRLAVESGRYLVGECGLYVSRILYRKISRGETFLVLDGGMHHNLAASGNLGQVLRKNFPIAAPQWITRPAEEKVHIVGPLCTPIDRLGTNVDLPALNAGDLVAVFSSGAYGFSASPRGFLTHPEPAEVIWGDS